MENEKKKTGYQSTWQDQLKDTANKIINREKFSYDLNGDALYKQYKDRYIQQGKQAMMDTMGQAQAMTGGYGNSYAQTVGQQTYQGYLQGLNDQVPQLYQIALDKYTREGADMRDNMNMMMQQDNIDYGRYRDQLADQDAAYNKLMALTGAADVNEYLFWSYKQKQETIRQKDIKLRNLREKLKKTKDALKKIKSSRSYRIGKKITSIIPHK
jgi:hypothetical protein